LGTFTLNGKTYDPNRWRVERYDEADVKVRKVRSETHRLQTVYAADGEIVDHTLDGGHSDYQAIVEALKSLRDDAEDAA